MSTEIRFVPETVWPQILEKIAMGSSLSSICRQKNNPSYSWCKLQLRENPILRQEYEQACRDRADLLAEEIERLADEEMPEGLDGPGKSAWVQRQRLRVDTRKWAASKLRPDIYGDKVLVDSSVKVDIRAAMAKAEERLLLFRQEGQTIDNDSGSTTDEKSRA